jgi:hypothetical protein
MFSVELERARETETGSVVAPQVVDAPLESAIPVARENVEDRAGKCSNFAVGANILLIVLLYFFVLAPSSPMAGPSRLKRIADVAIPSAELVPVNAGKHFRL